MLPAEVAFLRRLAIDKPEITRNKGVAARMLADHQIGRVQGSRVIYCDRDFESAASMLVNRGYALVAPQGPFTRSEAPSGGSEKTGALPVTHGLVGVVPLNIQHALKAPKGGMLVMPWSDAMALPYEVLLVSENLEPMLGVHEYAWLDDFLHDRPALAVFRGTAGLLRPDAPAALLAADTRPALAFFDFDPKGLSMAASIPRREALCLPPWPQLEETARRLRRTHLFTDQVHSSRAHLDRITDPEIALAWQRLKVLTIGLDQEGFPRL